jgi:hypothetical protein
MTFDPYLQGSYANSTNIRGNSDVDLVVETSAVYYSNLTEEEKRARTWTPGAFSWAEYYTEVLKALVNYYGAGQVHPGNKSIKVEAYGNRLPADVVPAVEYQEYRGGTLAGIGMTFWARDPARQVINFPKLHISNGSDKNASTGARYKPIVRVFKNARERIIGGDDAKRKLFPSYFIECLMFNVDNSCFRNTFQESYVAVVNDLRDKLLTAPNRMVCQNYMRELFGPTPEQWSVENATAFVQALDKIWREW